MVIQYAARENLTFETALECLVMEGFKAAGELSPVNIHVNNPVHNTR